MIFDYERTICGNPIVHLFIESFDSVRTRRLEKGRASVIQFTDGLGNKAVIAKTLTPSIDAAMDWVFRKSCDRIRPIKSPYMKRTEFDRLHAAILDSWNVSLPFGADGLREAQVGAIYACLSHWTTKQEPAVVVLPTGTGKTETLLALLAIKKPQKALLVVPTDPLRSQMFEKLMKMGKLKELGVLQGGSEYPVVGMIRRKFKDEESFQRFTKEAQYVVGTASGIARIPPSWIKNAGFDFLAVDEAHHLPARTWADIGGLFVNRTRILFTATPFRNDGKHIDGEVIYNYPLGKCQQLGIFRKMRFFPVSEFFDSKKDSAICNKALDQLFKMKEQGYEQVVMARVNTRKRADQILRLYRQHEGINAVKIVSGMSTPKKKAAKRALFNGEVDVVVCVNMLGEGFDFPRLKIAAIHDPHKSLPVMLQFVGRFTRDDRDDPGDASIIANIADEGMQDSLAALYSQDADWNDLIEGVYEEAVGQEIEFQRFIKGFINDGIRGFSLRNIRPVFSAYLYTFEGGFDLAQLSPSYNDGIKCRLALNTRENVGVIIERTDESVKWGNIDHLINTVYDCHCVFVSVPLGLIFIYSSKKDVPDDIAKTVSNSAKRIKDDKILRCLSGINRLLLTNMGLKQQLAGPIRYRSYLGMDVSKGIKERANSYTAMIYGSGFEDKKRSNIGCSLKGKVWSKNGGALLFWKKWCDHVGRKVKDDSISVNDIMDAVLVPVVIESVPDDRYIIALDWSEFFFDGASERSVFVHEGSEFDFYDCELCLVGLSDDRKRISFTLDGPGFEVQYILVLGGEGRPEGYTVELESGFTDVSVKVGRKEFPGAIFFKECPPIIWLDNIGCIAEGCVFVSGYTPGVGAFRSEELLEWDWEGVNIRRESQGVARENFTVQFRTIEIIDRADCILIVDDDDKGEAADVIAFHNREDVLEISLFHCKYSTSENPGRRIGDMYEVCGQAQKSIKWAGCPQRLLDHIRKRESKRQERYNSTRIEYGSLFDIPKLRALMKSKQIVYRVIVVQPGLSKSRMNDSSPEATAILRLLGSTRMYLSDTYGIELEVVCSQ